VSVFPVTRLNIDQCLTQFHCVFANVAIAHGVFLTVKDKCADRGEHGGGAGKAGFASFYKLDQLSCWYAAL